MDPNPQVTGPWELGSWEVGLEGAPKDSRIQAANQSRRQSDPTAPVARLRGVDEIPSRILRLGPDFWVVVISFYWVVAVVVGVGGGGGDGRWLRG